MPETIAASCLPSTRSSPASDVGSIQEHSSQEHSSQEHSSQASRVLTVKKPFVSIVVPAYNEALIISKNLPALCQYMQSLEGEYLWEIVVLNDGSKDDTGQLAEEIAKDWPDNIRVFHHHVNMGLGQALRSAFSHCLGDYIVVMDLDLSYEPYHISDLLTRIQQSRAKVVVASPYTAGGRISNVPWFRKILSIWANRFLSFAAKGNLSTLTGMVRVYDAEFLRDLSLRSMGMEINPEIIHKSLLLRAQVDEIPAHLRWHAQKARKAKKAKRRKSSMKVLEHTMWVIFSGFLLRPMFFFLVPGFILFALSAYANLWVLYHCFRSYLTLAKQTAFPDLTDAVAAAFYASPHAFIIGGITLILAIQLISLGILSLQNKKYFEEIFYLGTTLHRLVRQSKSPKKNSSASINPS